MDRDYSNEQEAIFGKVRGRQGDGEIRGGGERERGNRRMGESGCHCEGARRPKQSPVYTDEIASQASGSLAMTD